jgi:hypothetical protein
MMHLLEPKSGVQNVAADLTLQARKPHDILDVHHA